MSKILYTKERIPHLPLLIVDIEQQYATDYDMFKRLDKCCKAYNDLNNEVPIYFTGELKPYSKLSGLNMTMLPYWFIGQEGIHPEVVLQLQKYKNILVCGLWKEYCVTDISVRLHQIGINAIILDHPNYTIESGMIGLRPTIEDIERKYGGSFEEYLIEKI